MFSSQRVGEEDLDPGEWGRSRLQEVPLADESPVLSAMVHSEGLSLEEKDYREVKKPV